MISGLAEQRGWRRAAGMLVFLLLPALAAAATTDVVEVHCQAPMWDNLPLAKQSTPVDDYNPASMQYYQQWTLKHTLPPAIFCGLTAVLLVFFLLWRLARLASCMHSLRGKRCRGRDAADLLASRGLKWMKVGIVLLACGVIGSSGYGLSTIRPKLQPQAIQVFDDAKAYIATCLSTANSTAASVGEVESLLGAIRQRVVDLQFDQKRPGVLKVIDDFQNQVADVSASIHTAISDVQRQVLDGMEELQDKWQPQLVQLNIIKDALLFTSYVLLIAATSAVALGAAINCPGAVKSALFLLLLMIVVAWAAVAASTAGLKVGSDGCNIAEEKVLTALKQEAERQVAEGSGVLATLGIGGTLGLGRYYFYGLGKNASDVLEDLTGISIQQLITSADVMVAGLQKSAQGLRNQNTSAATLPDNLDSMAALIAGVASNVSALESAIAFDRFHAVYMDIKGYACCDVLNSLGDLWLGLLLVACFGLPLCVLCLLWINRMDRLEAKGCCHVYRFSDYWQGSDSGGVPELPDKRGPQGPEDSSTPPPTTSYVLRSKFNTRAWLRALSASPPAADGADSFRIRSAPFGSPDGARPGGGDRVTSTADVLGAAAANRPSAPALPAAAGWQQQGGRAASRRAPPPTGDLISLTPELAPPPQPPTAARAGGATSGATLMQLAQAVLSSNPLDLISLTPPQQQQQATDAEAADSSNGSNGSGGSSGRRASQALSRLKASLPSFQRQQQPPQITYPPATRSPSKPYWIP